MTVRARYFKLYDDKYIPGRWHLRLPFFEDGGDEEVREGEEREFFDTYRFVEGRFLEIQKPIRLTMKPAGLALDYSHALGVPVVHRRVVSLFERLGLEKDVQFIPVEVQGQTEPWFILNTLRLIRCIDDARCEEVLYWLPEDNRPDKEGQYRNVAGLKVDPQKVGGAHIFRPWGWKVVLIVSEHVKSALEAEGITGIKFIEV